jgi:alpha-tubulin suppressor-like RCC1 family protein
MPETTPETTRGARLSRRSKSARAFSNGRVEWPGRQRDVRWRTASSLDTPTKVVSMRQLGLISRCPVWIRRFAHLALGAACGAALTLPAPAQSAFFTRGQTAYDSRHSEAQWSAVSGGAEHTAAIDPGGRGVGWGRNDQGGCNAEVLPAGVTYASVSAGMYFTVAVRSDGWLSVWGTAIFGANMTPPTPPAGVTYVAVSAGGHFAAALRSDGRIDAWGATYFGVLDVPALPAGLSYTSIACGSTHSAALRSDGQLVLWGGENEYGQLDAPALPAGTSYVDASCGNYHTLALRSDGVVRSFGGNSWPVPTPPAGVSYVRVSAGGGHSVALRSDGELDVWGFGAGTVQVPPVLPSGVTYVAVDAGSSHTVALRSDGRVECFGFNTNNQCGLPRPPAGVRIVDLRVFGHVAALWSNGQIVSSSAYGADLVPSLPAGVVYTKLRSGVYFNAALRSDGQIACWGRNNAGQCDTPALPAGLTYVDFDARHDNSAAIRSDGSLVVWGSNDSGQLNVPQLPVGISFVEVSVGRHHVLARRSDGTVRAWGKNLYGQCNVPALPAGLTYVELATGDEFSVARRSDGSVVAWGIDIVGTLDVPALPSGVSYVSISAGGASGAARRSDGQLVSWGSPYTLFPGAPSAPSGSVLTRGVITGNSDTVFALESCTEGAAYCTSSLTTNGCTPSLSASGVASASATSGFTLACSNLEGQRTGLFFYGVSGPRDTPWATGSSSTLCVEAPTQRLTAQSSGGTNATCDGALAQDWLAFVAGAPAALGAPFAPGDAVYVQAWFRDPAAPRGTNLSNAIAFALCF